jgi:hypothetical protein
MTQRDDPASRSKLPRRFVDRMGMFPSGTPVRPATNPAAVVTHDSRDQFRYAVEEALDAGTVAVDPLAHL